MARPESLGLSSERLQRLDTHFEETYVKTGKLPFAMTLVARKGEVAHHGFSGLIDEARGTKVQADSLFRIYSMTKPLTSALFMMLVEEGKVALDDPVPALIPEWKTLGVYAGGWDLMQKRPCTRPMQMIDLLRHTSGLTYGFQQRTNVDAAYRKHNRHDREVGEPGRDDRQTGRSAPGVLPRRGLELLRLHRHPRLPDRQDRRTAV
jgi:CubicO group peptidase (beta-lactamase class C family)